MSRSLAESSSERFGVYDLAGPTPPPPPGHSWSSLMTQALAAAKTAQGAGEVPVGAVLVDAAGVIVAVGANSSLRCSDCTAHAEIVALRRGGRVRGNYRLNDCILVVTLEPCRMCAAAIWEARLAGVVYGATDVLYGAVVSQDSLLDPPAARGRHIWHMGGVRANDCARLLTEFFAGRRSPQTLGEREDVRADRTP